MPRMSRVDALLALMVLIWGANFAVVKAALREFHPLGFNALRFSLAALLIVAVLWRRQRNLSIQKSDWMRLLGLALVGNMLYQVLFIIGLSMTRAADATLILAVTPMVTLLLSVLMRTEKIHWYSITGALLAFLGVVLVVHESGGHVTEEARNPLLGGALLCGCALCWSLYTVLSVPLLQRYGSLKFTSYTMVLGALFLLPFGALPLARQDWSKVSYQAWSGLVLSASGALVFCYVVWYHAVKRLGNSRTSVYSNLIPAVGLLCAWVFLGERLGLGHLLGMLLIVFGIIITRKAPRPAAPETGT